MWIVIHRGLMLGLLLVGSFECIENDICNKEEDGLRSRIGSGVPAMLCTLESQSYFLPYTYVAVLTFCFFLPWMLGLTLLPLHLSCF